MSTLLATFADSEVKVKFKEPFLTEGMNRTGAAAMSPGIYRGFKLIANVTNNLLTVEDDPDTGDHVLVFETDDGYSIHIRKTGDFTIDFTGLSVSTTYIIAVYATYGLNQTTAAYIRAYTQAEYDAAPEKDQLVIFGTGTTPGSLPGTITPALDQRTLAWHKIAPGERSWSRVVESGGFENLPDIGTLDNTKDLPGWYVKGLGTDLVFSIAHSSVHSGANNLQVAGQTVSGQGSLAVDRIVAVEPGSLIDIAFWIRGSLWSGVTSGHQGIYYIFYNNDMTFVSQGFVEDTSLSGTFSWTEIQGFVEAPANARFVKFAILVQSTAAMTGTLFFDDLAIFVESPSPAKNPNHPLRSGIMGASKLISALMLGKHNSGDPIEDMVQIGQTLTGSSVDAGKYDGAEWLLRLLEGKLEFDGLIASATEAAKPRIATSAADYTVADYTLLWESQDAGGDFGNVRVYVGQGTALNNASALYLTNNAHWTETQWERDEAAYNSGMLLVGNQGLEFHIYLSSAVSPWNDTDWDDGTNGFEQLIYQWGSTGLDNRGRLQIRGQLEELGEGLLSSSSYGAVPRIHAHFPAGTTAKFVCLLHLDNQSGQGDVRVYVSDGFSGDLESGVDKLVITLNARWSGSGENWTYDDSTLRACRISVLKDGVRFYSKEANGTTDPWTDTEWADDSEGFELLNFAREAIGKGNLSLDGRLELLMPPTAVLTESTLDTSARIHAEAGPASVSPLTLMRHYESSDVSGPEFREYVEADGTDIDIYKTYNARYDYNGGTPQWISDDSSEDAMLTKITSDGWYYVYREPATASPWTSWGTPAYQFYAYGGGTPHYSNLRMTDGLLYFNGSGLQTNPTLLAQQSSSPLANSLYGLSMPKAWGMFTSGASTVVHDGFNIDDAVTYTSGRAQVLILRDLDSVSGQYYAVLLSALRGTAITLVGSNLADTGFQIEAFDAAGSQITLNDNAVDIMFVVFARQDS